MVGADTGGLVGCGGLGVLGSGDSGCLGLVGSGGVLLGLAGACLGVGDLPGGLGPDGADVAVGVLACLADLGGCAVQGPLTTAVSAPSWGYGTVNSGAAYACLIRSCPVQER